MALYLTALAERCKASTIQRRVSAISQWHQAAGHSSPTLHVVVRETMKGIRRALGTAPQQKTAAGLEIVRAMVEALPPTTIGARDRALILIGFGSAMRRSELVALDVADVKVLRDGLTIRIRKSKTDQEGRGRSVGVPYGSNPATCAVAALQA